MLNIISVFIPSIFLILTGLLLKSCKILHLEFWDSAEKLNYYILFPALLFFSLATVKNQPIEIKNLFIIIFIVMFIVILITYIFTSISKTPISRIGVYIQSLIRFNTYIGLSIALAMQNPQIKSNLVSILAIIIPFVNVISIISLTSKEDLNIKSILQSLMKNPLINSCLLGMLWNYFSIEIWKWLDSLLSILSSSSLMLGLLCVGAALNLEVIRCNFKKSLFISSIRLIIIPLLAFWVSSFFILNTASLIAVMIFFSIPTASSAYVLTKILKGDHQLMAGIISFQTILSIISLPMIIYLIRG